jgi:hypothetical protein
LRKGTQILKIQRRDVGTLDADEARSLINAHATMGLDLGVRLPDGNVRDVMLKEDAMYPEVDEGLDVP